MHQHQSVWGATAELPAFAPLEEDARADACVVGAGIAGLTAAYLMAAGGRSVLVLDDGPVGGGMTQMTTGHLTNMLDDRYFEVERLHGEDGARIAAQSHTQAIDLVERIVQAERIDCDFARLDGYLFLAEGDSSDTLTRELEAAHRAGLRGVQRALRAPYAWNTGPCLRFPQVAQFHVLRYLAGLARSIVAMGGRIFTGSHVDAVDEAGERVTVRCGRFTVECGAAVVATNVPINDRLALHTKQAPYMTYVIGARAPRGSVPAILAWDTGDPYHYLRIHPMEDADLLIIGGEDHKSGQAGDAEARHSRLEAWARERFPAMGPLEFAWGGQVMETIDHLAFAGRNPGEANVYVITGDSGMGLTHGTLGARIVADLSAGRANPWAWLYEPSRKTAGALGEYARENLNVARQYAQWVTPGEVRSETEIGPGSGAIMRRGLSKLAVYRDADGALHEHNAACPHLGCVVQWNGAEKTWDCPCHGSRFDPRGKVINGPANRDLASAEPRSGRRAA